MRKSVSSSKRYVSPRKSPRKSQAQNVSYNQWILSKMRKNREILTSTLDTYTLIVRSNQPMRCLQHNSNITVYCDTEQKLLCANCMLIKNEHKFHKVLPLDKSYEKIRKSVEVMIRQIDRETNSIIESCQCVRRSCVLNEQIMQQLLVELARMHDECKIKLQQNFIRVKKSLLEANEKSKDKHAAVLSQLQFLLKVRKDQIHEKLPESQQFLQYEQIMCSTILSHSKIYNNKWKPPQSGIKELGQLQQTKIREVENLIASYIR